MNHPIALHGARFCLSIVPALLIASTAHAQLKPWSINEIYSNADGSVQFIELATAPAPGGLLGAGYQFLSQNGPLTHSYATPVSQFSGGGFDTLLFATIGYTQLSGAVTPDYTIPIGFLFTPGGTLTVKTVSDNFPSVLTYLNLPADGIHSLDLNGNITVALREILQDKLGSCQNPPRSHYSF